MTSTRSASRLGLEAIANELSPPQAVDLDEARAERALGMKPLPDPVVHFAPQGPPLALPEYVSHNGDTPRSGMISAAAIVHEFEATAREIEKLGEELKAAQARAAEGQEVFAKALADLTSTAAAYRKEAVVVFQRVENVTTKASEASALAQELRNKIAAQQD
jgi:hypothetical protein